MKKRIIRVCSCLLEIAVWYSLGDMGSWCFEIELLKYYEKADFFLLAETTCSLEYVDGQICYTTTIYSCCKKCVNFLVFYKNSTSKFLNQIDCSHVKNDMTVFYDGYEQQIYIPREFEIDEENKVEVDLPMKLISRVFFQNKNPVIHPQLFILTWIFAKNVEMHLLLFLQKI